MAYKKNKSSFISGDTESTEESLSELEQQVEKEPEGVLSSLDTETESAPPALDFEPTPVLAEAPVITPEPKEKTLPQVVKRRDPLPKRREPRNIPRFVRK